MYILYKDAIPIGYCLTKHAANRAKTHYEFAYKQEHNNRKLSLSIQKIDAYLLVRFGYAYMKYMEGKENVACSRY